MTLSIEERRARRREAQRLYKLAHPEAVKASNDKYHEKERIRKGTKRKPNPEKAAETQRDRWITWEKAHPNHREDRAKVKASRVAYRHSEKGKVATKKREARRRQIIAGRAFCLNQHFPGSHLHHIEPSITIYIPASLHNSTPHDLMTGRGMIQLNDKISQWLLSKESGED